MITKRRTMRLPQMYAEWGADHRRARVLLECSDPAKAWAAENELKRAGYDTAVCWGPSVDRRTTCPLLAEGRCGLAEMADVIVQSFTLAERHDYPLLHAVRQALPDTPVCVEVPGPSLTKYGDDLTGCHVIERPMTEQRLVATVRDASTGAKP